MMTVAYVAGAVRKIYDMRDDDEAAHSEEDRLHQEVLKAIADGTCEDPQACAQQALMTQASNLRDGAPKQSLDEGR